MADQREREIDDALGEPAGVHDLSGENEKRHGKQREAVRAVDQVLREDLRIELVEVDHQGDAAGEQREGDRNAERHRPEQRAQEDGDGHSSSFTMTSSSSRARPVIARQLSRTSSTAADTANTTPEA
jgi:hypothetical protein